MQPLRFNGTNTQGVCKWLTVAKAGCISQSGGMAKCRLPADRTTQAGPGQLGWPSRCATESDMDYAIQERATRRTVNVAKLECFSREPGSGMGCNGIALGGGGRCDGLSIARVVKGAVMAWVAMV